MISMSVFYFQQMLYTFKYGEITWEMLMEKSALEVRVKKPPRTVIRLRTRQAGVIDHLMRQLQQLNSSTESHTTLYI